LKVTLDETSLKSDKESEEDEERTWEIEGLEHDCTKQKPSNIKVKKCPQCEYVTSYPGNLSMHIRLCTTKSRT
jgi:HD superfamily phosphohydrolase YqeK